MQLLQWTIATGRPDGVVTMSISGYAPERGFSSTTIANTLVPAETLPVRAATAFVATMPVPASPSGGAMSAPGLRTPVGSMRRAPSSVSRPAAAPAGRTSGSSAARSAPDAARYFSRRAASHPPEASTGNIPDASPTPSAFTPESRQWTHPASVVRCATAGTCASPSRRA